MAYEIFVDTGAWYAINDEGDNLHSIASEFYQQLSQTFRPLVTTNLVIAESQRLLLYNGGYQTAIQFLDSLSDATQQGRLQIVYSSPSLEIEAKHILIQYSDQVFTYTDAVSFAVMQQLAITDAFAFDDHFSTMNFVRLPPKIN